MVKFVASFGLDRREAGRMDVVSSRNGNVRPLLCIDLRCRRFHAVLVVAYRLYSTVCAIRDRL